MTEEGARWVEVSSLDRLADRGVACVRVKAVDLLLLRDGERVVACERACPHEQADLSRGCLRSGRLFCPRHLASFDLGSGQISAGWPSRPLQLYPVEIRDGRIWIDAAAVVTASG
jgi:3-phenylpropionate/trans-cinnamate dioxygenase ferredoxin component